VLWIEHVLSVRCLGIPRLLLTLSKNIWPLAIMGELSVQNKF